jgi:hypothetical protein
MVDRVQYQLNGVSWSILRNREPLTQLWLVLAPKSMAKEWKMLAGGTQRPHPVPTEKQGKPPGVWTSLFAGRLVARALSSLSILTRVSTHGPSLM